MRLPIIFRFWRVKFTHWIWFFFFLGGDEFSYKLSVAYWYRSKGTLDGLSKAREKAHKIEEALST
jgi:hypothetical protein